MQTEIEKRMGKLVDPPVPPDLRDRCFKTIPVTSANQNVSFPKAVRPLRLQRLFVPSALLFAAVVGVAFLSTRPSYHGKGVNAGSVAFAQVLEATRQVKFFHIKGRVAASQDGKKTVKTSDVYLSESWYDENRGFYNQQVQAFRLGSSRTFKFPKGTSVYSRNLFLPDGTIFMRPSGATTVYAIPNRGDARVWNRYKTFLVSQLTRDVEGRTDFNHRTNGNILSSIVGNWKGQKVQILVFERQPDPRRAQHQGALPIRVHFYVNPRTNLVVAEQDFIVFPETPPALIAEYEFDYTKPDPALFDSKRMTQGATIRDTLEPVQAPPQKQE